MIISVVCANIVAALVYIEKYDTSTLIIWFIGMFSTSRIKMSRGELVRMTHEQRFHATMCRIILTVAYISLFIVIITNLRR